MRSTTTTLPDVQTLRAAVAARLPEPPPGAPEADLETRCRRYLEQLRWPEGAECPRCGERDRLYWMESRRRWQCYACRYQFSVTAGTLLHNSHLPLWKWFAAVHLVVESPHGVSANQLRSILGGSYKTWWFATHRIRAAHRGEGEALLRAGARRKRARGEDPIWEELAALLQTGALETAPRGVAARVRRLVAGPYHQLSTKHLAAYVDERGWRAANRGNPHLFRDTLLALLRGEGLSYEQLVAAA